MRGARISITFSTITRIRASMFFCIAFFIVRSNAVCFCAMTYNSILRSAISAGESHASDRLGFGGISTLLGAACISISWFSFDSSGVLAVVAVYVPGIGVVASCLSKRPVNCVCLGLGVHKYVFVRPSCFLWCGGRV